MPTLNSLVGVPTYRRTLSGGPVAVADPLDTSAGPAGLGTGGPLLNPNPSSPRFSGDAGRFLEDLYRARPKFIEQQQQLLSTLGPGLRQAVFAASPELAQASQYLTQTFSDPFGGQLSTFQDALRGAQAARGFGVAAGTGPSGEEARYLTNYAAQRRDALLPQLSQFGQGVLNIGGLGAPPDISLSALGGLALQNRSLAESIKAGQQQSATAQDLFRQYMDALTKSNPFGGAAGGSVVNRPGGSRYGGGTTSVIVGSGGGSLGPFERGPGGFVGGQGYDATGTGFGQGLPQAAKYDRARVLLASGILRTEKDYLNYIGQGSS